MRINKIVYFLFAIIVAFGAFSQNELTGKYVGLIKGPLGWTNYKCYVTISSYYENNFYINFSYGIKNIAIVIDEESATDLRVALAGVKREEKIVIKNGSRWNKNDAYQKAWFKFERGYLSQAFAHEQYRVFSRKSLICGKLTPLKK